MRTQPEPFTGFSPHAGGAWFHERAVMYRYRFCFPFMLLLLVGLFSPPAHADGGAPQLAYVAGAAQGISIIDIARRRVTGTIAVAGNPRTVLLSLDGQTLYVT